MINGGSAARALGSSRCASTSTPTRGPATGRRRRPSWCGRRRSRAGSTSLAITDHDTADGWDEAAETAADVGHHAGPRDGGQHPAPRARRAPAGLPARPDVPTAGRRAGQDPRRPRLPGPGHGRPAAWARHRRSPTDDVRRAAGDAAATGRPHVRRRAGRPSGSSADRDEAFRLFLGGRPARRTSTATPRRCPTWSTSWRAAGGVRVVAHPWGRHERTSLDRGALAELAGRGLAGIEVDHQDHDAASRADAACDRPRPRAWSRPAPATTTAPARSTTSSGCNTTDPDEFERLLALADAAAARSGRRTPEVVDAVSDARSTPCCWSRSS